MKELINKQKSNLIIALGAAVVIILITGGLGLGQYLNNRLAFGYGGGSVITPITSVNRPLVLPDIQKGGRLFKDVNGVLIELEVPPLSTNEYALYDVLPVNINNNNNVCAGEGSIISNIAFTVFAKDRNDQPISKFGRYLNISVTMAGIPVNSSNVGVYYLNSNQQWVLGGQGVLNIEDSKVTFRTSEAGTFALINTNGLPRLIESQSRCSGLVLGATDYADGSVLRTCDAQLYQIKNQVARSIGRLSLTEQTYKSSPVFDVDYDIIVRYTPDGSGPNRQKDFSTGDLLRTCDWKVYRVEGNSTFRHVNTYEELQARFEGQIINNVDYWQIAKYRNIAYSPTDSAVLGEKIYETGSLIRTDDNKVYIVQDQTVQHLVTLPKTINYFAGQPIFNVNFEVLETHQNRLAFSDARVLGAKAYGDGALLRTRDWKVYRVENGQLKQVAFFPNPNQTTFEGQKINDVDYGELAQFTRVNDVPNPDPTSQVLGVKTYADGTLLRIPNGKIYIIINNKPVIIANLEELQRYAGREIFNISQINIDELLTEVTTGGQVLGVKAYGDGALLKTPDWKIYEVNGDMVNHIATYPGTQLTYQGRKLNIVSFEDLTQYEMLK